MHIKRCLLAALLLVSAIAGHAFRLNAEITDVDGEPQAYATYKFYLLPDSANAVQVGTADEQGRINAKLRRTGRYKLVVSYVGLPDLSCRFEASDANAELKLGKLKMTASDNTLGTLEVVAQKPLVVKEIDRIGYDVQSDEESKTSNLSDILRKVPMVAVDADGTITVNGSSNFKIFKDGRPSKNYSSNAKDLFKAIPASMIKRIEVITQPGAKYDAEGVGAILNIVTVEGMVVKGAMGTVSTEISSLNPVPSLHGYLNGQVDKVNLSFYGGAQYINKESQRSNMSSEMNYNNGNVQKNRGESWGKGGFGYFGTSLSWEPDSLNLFNLEANGAGYTADGGGAGRSELFGPDGKLVYGYTNETTVPAQSFFNIDANLNYQRNMRRKGEYFTLSYQISTQDNRVDNRTRYTDMVSMPVPYTGQDYTNKLNFIEHTFQADWTCPTLKGQTLDLGAKYILRRNRANNDYKYIGYDTISDRFLHLTDVGALYAQYSVRAGSVGVRGGLRYEMSKLKAEFADKPGDNFGTTLHDLVPSVDLSWNVDERNTLTFNYATRINRPGIEYLNPAHTLSPGGDSYGNPELESAMNHSMTLQYSMIGQKFNCNLSAGYEMSNNGIVSSQFLKGNVLHSTYVNAGRQRTFGVSGYMQWTIARGSRLMFNGSLNHNKYIQDNYKMSRWTPMGFMMFTQQLPWRLNATLMANWIDFGAESVYTYSAFEKWYDKLYMNIGLSRSFLKEDRLSVELRASNPFGPSKRIYTSVTQNGDVTGTSYNTHYNNMRVGLRVSYRFGSFSSQVKKTVHSISNDDVVGGAQKGAGGGQ